VSWTTVPDIFETGTVETVFQTHSRRVTLQLKDGSEVSTREPRIDLVFDVIEECGAPCADIIVITE